MKSIDIEWVRAKLAYDPDSGEISFRKSGKLAGCVSPRGYKVHSIRGRNVFAQAIAWILMRRELPPPGRVLDHKDRNPINNAWSNLRLVPKSIDAINRRIPKSNQTGYRGVSRHSHGYEASIRRCGTKYYLGLHKTPEEASTVYEQAALMFEQMQGFRDALDLNAQIGRIAKDGLCLVPTEKPSSL
jgi:hypothetical protein